MHPRVILNSYEQFYFIFWSAKMISISLMIWIITLMIWIEIIIQKYLYKSHNRSKSSKFIKTSRKNLLEKLQSYHNRYGIVSFLFQRGIQIRIYSSYFQLSSIFVCVYKHLYTCYSCFKCRIAISFRQLRNQAF